MSSSSPSGTTGLVEELLDALARWVPALLPDPARAGAIVQACRAAGAQLDPAVELSDAVALIERAAQVHSRHLLLFVDPSGSRTPDTEDRGWPPPDLRAVRRRAGGVRSVDRADNGIATIRVDSLEPFDVAEPYLEAAVALAARATGVILDLRANGGGDPATVAYLAGFVLGPQPRTLSEVHHRDGITRQWRAGDEHQRRLRIPAVLEARGAGRQDVLDVHDQRGDRGRRPLRSLGGKADHVDLQLPAVHRRQQRNLYARQSGGR